MTGLAKCDCGECRPYRRRRASREWAQRNRAARAAKDRAYREANAERFAERDRERARKYREENRDLIAERDRRRRQENGPYQPDPVKTRARVAVRSLVRQPCEVCGDPRSEGHHADYFKPLDVCWLCKRHHGEVHRKYGQVAA